MSGINEVDQAQRLELTLPIAEPPNGPHSPSPPGSPNRIMITQPEEIFDRVPRVRTRPHRAGAVAQSSPNFSQTQPRPPPSSARAGNNNNNNNNNSHNNNNNSHNNNYNNRNSLSSTQKVALDPPGARPKSTRQNMNSGGNRKNFASTMPLNRARPGSSRTTSTENLLPKRTYTLTPELESLKKQAIEQEPLEVEDNSMIEDLLLLLSEERRQFAAQHQFKESQKRNEAIGYVMECQTWMQKLEMQKASMHEFEQRQEEYKSQAEEFDTESAQLRHKLKKKLRHKREKLLEEQAQEVRELEEFWASEPKSRLYNRSSNTLICLRRQLAILLTQCRFEDAAEVQAQIDARVKLEETENHELMQREFNEVFNKMKTRQNEDLAYFDQNADMEMRKLNRRRDKLREALVNRERKINEKGDQAKDVNKVWNAKQTMRTSEVANTQSRSPMPSLKVSKKDINDKQVQKLSLPPLAVPKYDPRKNPGDKNAVGDKAAATKDANSTAGSASGKK